MSVGAQWLRLVDAAVASPMDVLGLALLAVLVYVLWRAQRTQGNKIDLAYLLVDSTTGTVTLAKFSGFGAFLASTWIVVDLTITGHFDTTFAGFYMGIWGGAKVATDWALRGRPSEG